MINLFGLTIGLTGCLLIALYISDEISYDHFQLNGNRTVRVIMEYRFDGSGQSNKGNYTSLRVAKVFKNTFPEVESAVIMTNRPRVIRYGETLINEKAFMFAGPAFLMFSPSRCYRAIRIKHWLLPGLSSSPCQLQKNILAMKIQWVKSCRLELTVVCTRLRESWRIVLRIPK